METRIMLGDRVRDSITGFEGTVTAKCEYLNGCIQFCVKPNKLSAEGKMIDGEFIDEEQLEVISSTEEKQKKAENGGPMPDTPGEIYAG